MRSSGVWRPAIGMTAALFCAGCGVESAGVAQTVAKPAPPPASPAPRRVELVWPTPNPAYFRGGGVETFVQPTVSGNVLSGLFGSVRSGGRQFHEGVDLAPIQRDRKGEAMDAVVAAMAGVVRHVSGKPGASNYGRYVVLEHPDESPPVYTLYAHLAEIAPGLAEGRRVQAGARLGTMGRSASGQPITKDRAHLHFEIGLRVTDNFQAWYRRQGFGSPNEQGLWNGMNLMGIDPLEVFARYRAGGLRGFDEVFAALPIAATVRIAQAAAPDFIRRYPSLVFPDGPAPGERPAGWEISLSATGVPVRWRRLGASVFVGWRSGEAHIVGVDTELLRANRGRSLVKNAGRAPVPDEDLRTLLDQLF